MDEQAALVALTELVARYPDITMTIVADVLQACGQDTRRAYDMLCEMVIPADERAPTNTEAATAGADTAPAETSPKRSPPRPTRPVSYTCAEDLCTLEPKPLSPVTERRAIIEGATSPAPRGAWANRSIGRRYRVSEICERYPWMQRSVVEDLFAKYNDCVELVEDDILRMFPIDEPQAFGAGRADSPKPTGVRGTGLTSRQSVMAKSLRDQAADEMRREANGGESVSMASTGMAVLRQQLWETRETRMRLHVLASQTRKPSHVADAKAKDDEMKRLSAYFLNRIRQSDEYRNGVIDLHGLTKDEAIQLVEWKLRDGGRKRFRLITGKGIHSHNGQAVLKPALEKHFRSKRVSFTQTADGVLSVIFP